MPVLKIAITDTSATRTVKQLLREDWQFSTALLARLKRTERAILLDGAPVFVTETVRNGSVLTVDISDPPPKTPIPPVAGPLSIVYEDDFLLVVDKPAFLPSIPSSLKPSEVSLANLLAGRYGDGFCYHPVNRLDRSTTGLMLVAKCGYIHDRLRQMLHGALRREYRGIAVGTVRPESGRIDLPIARAADSLIRRRTSPDGAEAHTLYETLASNGRCTLLRLTPLSGRTHQLRLHMAAIGFPLAGDFLYGTEDPALIGRSALHSAELWLPHPVTGEALHFLSPLPEDMRRLMEG